MSTPNSLYLSTKSTFTTSEQQYISYMQNTVPNPFLKKCPSGMPKDAWLLTMLQQGLDDFNNTPPCSSYTVDSFPKNRQSLLFFGANLYISFFKQLEYAMIDISYSDGGLTITIDRVGKLNTAIANMERNWLRMLENAKKCMLISQGGKGLATPRYQSNLSRFIGMFGDGAYGWGVV